MPRVEVNGIETYYEEYGTGHPIVVLHGATADHQAWAEQLQPLSEEYRVIPCDLRGHGKTGATDRSTYTVDMYAEDLAAFIEALGLDDPTVLGHSLGGMIGYAYADAHPDGLSALITVGSQTTRSFSKAEWLYKQSLVHVFTPLGKHERLMHAITWGLTKIFGEDATVDEGELQEIRDRHDCAEQELQTGERAKILDAASKYFDSSRSIQFDGLPFLMLYGENEPMIEPHAEHLERQFDECQTAEVPTANHNAQIGNPEFIRTKIRTFLNDAFDEQGEATTR